jgi:membrane-bound metal-dependent hydrolase YbcI (DUF457 family)
MPFTPFHMGPGILIKALLQGSFSLMVFGWAQIVMDIQPLFVLLTGEGHLHGFSHTYIGATLLAIFSALSGKYLSELGLKLIGIVEKSNPVNIVWWVAFVSAFIGTFSHVVLDGIMHSDVEPFYPLSQANSLLGLISVSELHQFCLYSALIGAAVYYSVQYVAKKNNQGDYDILWITSEICYYLGLVLAVLFMPGLTFTLWMMSLADKIDLNFWYILIAWVLSVLMFLSDVGLKNFIYSAKNNQNKG